ncbi:MAG: cytochrome P450 [Pseudomonadota bacterium]
MSETAAPCRTAPPTAEHAIDGRRARATPGAEREGEARRRPSALYRPPAPPPVSPTMALWRAISTLERDLITLLPGDSYHGPLDGPLGYSRRSIFLLNDPETVQRVLGPDRPKFPKNELMVGALAPVVGDGLFISEGMSWERQRRMIDPAFAHMRVSRAFHHMAEATDDALVRLDRAAATGTRLSLEAELSGLTADIVFRTIFSQRLDEGIAAEVFERFARFQRSVANVRITHLLLAPAFAEVRQPRAAMENAEEIRRLVGAMLDARLAGAEGDDLCADILAARDPETGEGFTRTEMLDQLAVFFMAGHETTASALTWAMFILSQQPEVVARIRAEIAEVAGDGPLDTAAVKRLTLCRAAFREALRLYPPVTFLARVALEPCRIGAMDVPRGGMVLVSPWTMHRHEALWRDADRFDPDRFLGGESEIRPGSYIPFGAGPRLCIGTAFAMQEAVLIMASLVRRYDLAVERPEKVRPVARLTTRPARDITFVPVRR